MHFIPTTVILLVAIVYGLRYFRPFGNELDGERFLVRSVPLLARMRMHIVPALVGVVLAGILARTAGAPVWTIAVPIAIYLILLAVPISYTLTSDGVRLGYGTFRRWTEFAGAIRYRGGAKLQGANGRRGLRIWLSGGLGDDEFLLILRRAIRDAYKGGERSNDVAFSSEAHPTEEHSTYSLPA